MCLLFQTWENPPNMGWCPSRISSWFPSKNPKKTTNRETRNTYHLKPLGIPSNTTRKTTKRETNNNQPPPLKTTHPKKKSRPWRRLRALDAPNPQAWWWRRWAGARCRPWGRLWRRSCGRPSTWRTARGRRRWKSRAGGEEGAQVFCVVFFRFWGSPLFSPLTRQKRLNILLGSEFQPRNMP